MTGYSPVRRGRDITCNLSGADATFGFQGRLASSPRMHKTDDSDTARVRVNFECRDERILCFLEQTGVSGYGTESVAFDPFT